MACAAREELRLPENVSGTGTESESSWGGDKMKVLVTGAAGQIGSELVPVLQNKWGKEMVVAVDIKSPGPWREADAGDKKALEKIVREEKIEQIYHLVSLISAVGEKNPDKAWEVNVGTLKNVLDLARDYKLAVFWPSSIAAFGKHSPQNRTPQHTSMEPETMYGVTKVTGELLAQYYFRKWGVDVRSVRFPGIISWKTEPGGGTTDYASYMFYAAIKKEKYQCFLTADTRLPMMYMDDAVRAAIKLMEAPAEAVKIRTSYNLAAVSFSPEELAAEINKQEKLEVSYEPDFRQQIAESWPQSIDDASARKDWGWKEEVGLEKMVEIMLLNLRKKLI